MKLVKFCCGCIGFEPTEFMDDGVGTLRANAVVIRSCDGDEPYGMHWRVVDYSRAYESGPKAGEVYQRAVALNDSDRATVMAAIDHLIADGYRMRAVKALLRERED